VREREREDRDWGREEEEGEIGGTDGRTRMTKMGDGGLAGGGERRVNSGRVTSRRWRWVGVACEKRWCWWVVCGRRNYALQVRTAQYMQEQQELSQFGEGRASRSRSSSSSRSRSSSTSKHKQARPGRPFNPLLRINNNINNYPTIFMHSLSSPNGIAFMDGRRHDRLQRCRILSLSRSIKFEPVVGLCAICCLCSL
jgi:hypothetical protein